jgi:hypothetical protein
MKRLIIASILCSLLVFASCGKAEAAATSAAATTATPEQLQSQIKELSDKVSVCNGTISTLQSKINALETATVSIASPQDSSEIDDIKTNITKLTNAVITISNEVTALQTGLQASVTTIGNTSVEINGLGIVFITKDIPIGPVGSATPGVAQFAIKIVNTSGKAITNIDITGVITSSQSLSISMASGYPQLTDGAGLCNYAFSSSGTNTLSFEAYSNTKTTLAIPAGGSITLRPKLTTLAATGYQLPATSYIISLSMISYDVVIP